MRQQTDALNKRLVRNFVSAKGDCSIAHFKQIFERAFSFDETTD